MRRIVHSRRKLFGLSMMVTKTEFSEAVEKLDNRLTAVESKIGGIDNRIDDEALKRANLETRVRSPIPNLPPPPERVEAGVATDTIGVPALPPALKVL